MAKLPGKTAYSGVRRPATRTAGFTSRPDATGAVWRSEASESFALSKNSVLTISFEIPKHLRHSWVSFGGWYWADNKIRTEINSPAKKHTLTRGTAPDWSKFGSMWQGDGSACIGQLTVFAKENAVFSVWNLGCGLVENPGCHSASDFVECTDEGYLRGMHKLSPEAHFWRKQGSVTLAMAKGGRAIELDDTDVYITLKTCNRCARFLPINTHNERIPLSFSNHCVARHPCMHSGFGRLKNEETGELLDLEYGYQLECRYCKKFCVNAAHNPQRTSAQMKEDGARRRHF